MKRFAQLLSLILCLALALPAPAVADSLEGATAMPVAIDGDAALDGIRETLRGLYALDPALGSQYSASLDGSFDWGDITTTELAQVRDELAPPAAGARRFVAQLNGAVFLIDLAKGTERQTYRVASAPSFSDLAAVVDLVRVEVTATADGIQAATTDFLGTTRTSSMSADLEPVQCDVGNLCSAGSQFAVNTAASASCAALGVAATAPTFGISAVAAAIGCTGFGAVLGATFLLMCSSSGDISCSQRIDGNLFNINQGGCSAFNACGFKGTTTSKANLVSVDGIYIYTINGYTSFEIRNISTGYRRYFQEATLLTGEKVMRPEIGFFADTNSRREQCSRGLTVDAYANFTSGRAPRSSYVTSKDGAAVSEGYCGRAT